jgi:dipeptidyl aminopeptidase/acylaminoacyl peptidase
MESATKRPLTFEDCWKLAHVSDVQPSPDGATIAYVVTSLDENENISRSAVWLGDIKGGHARRFTSGEAQDTQPRWSSGGRRLAFVSTRTDAKPQIFVIDVQGGEPRRLTDSAEGATTPVWSPDATRICFSSAIPTDEQKVQREETWLERHPDLGDKSARMRRQSTLLSRMDGRGYVDRRIHLFLIDVETPGAETRQLTDGEYDDVEPAWSPDGSLIAFVSNRQEGREYSMGSDLWTIDVDTSDLTNLTGGGLGCLAPSWSPDGQTLACYAAPDAPGCGYHFIGVYLVSRTGGDAREVSTQLEANCGITALPDYALPAATPPAWSSDGKTLYFVATRLGDAPVFALSLHDGSIRSVINTKCGVVSVRVSAHANLLAGLASTPTHPFDVFVASTEGGELQFPFGANRELLAEVELSLPERLSWKGPDGWEVEGWLIRPPMSDEKASPLILTVHGGPHHMFGNTFYFQNQVLAGAGYAVLYTNPRGSTGYGHAFAAAADWGQKDYEDIMAGVDAAITAGGIDPARMGVTGISYGGFMTDWIVGHTDRFSGGVSVNGVSNFVSFFGVADIGPLWFEREFPECFGSPFWKDAATLQRYIERSPITYVDRIQTPLLLIQSENDYRCPIDQGEQMLSALRFQGKTVDLIRVPGASHVIFATGSPHHRYLQWVLLQDWFDTHVKGGSKATAHGGAEPALAATTPNLP